MPVAVDLASPDAFVHGAPHEQLAELRRTSPVYFQEMRGEPGFYAVLKHADLVHVARHSEVFSASEGGVVLENLAPDQLEMMRMMLLAMDPPRHQQYRAPLSDHFKAKVIAGLDDGIRTITQSIMKEAAAQRDVEFVHDVTAKLPTRVIGQLMGLPEDDWPLIHQLAERNTSGQDPDVAGETADYSASIEMAMYAIEFAAVRRAEAPREDLTSVILGSDYGGASMTDVDFGSFFVQLVTAGNDTTKTMLAGGLLALLQHSDQLDELRADPSLTAGAVEEILRWANPLHYFRRTALADTELHGVPIEKGAKVAMYYTSANRDEDVFADSQRFDIHRHPNPHLSFGIAEHFCLGVHLARLEGKVFFEELLAAFPRIDLTGDPIRLRSNLNNAIKRLPIRLS
ncbi:MAG TPA: cytochrome P450 [Acidimicrobiales bacterium]|nr:cytochrome P450 [Acidimicrobiales bacterium]